VVLKEKGGKRGGGSARNVLLSGKEGEKKKNARVPYAVERKRGGRGKKGGRAPHFQLTGKRGGKEGRAVDQGKNKRGGREKKLSLPTSTFVQGKKERAEKGAEGGKKISPNF